MIAASLRTLVTHNFVLKAVALLAAFGLWYNIASEPELATIVSVPIDYKNFPKDLVISSEPVDSVSVEARGPANELRAMQQTRIAAVIDFSSVHAPGERTFTLTSAELRPPRGVTLLRAVTTNVDGSGIRVAQPEAFDYGTTNWEVNPASSPVLQSASLFFYTADAGSVRITGMMLG